MLKIRQWYNFYKRIMLKILFYVIKLVIKFVWVLNLWMIPKIVIINWYQSSRVNIFKKFSLIICLLFPLSPKPTFLFSLMDTLIIVIDKLCGCTSDGIQRCYPSHTVCFLWTFTIQTEIVRFCIWFCWAFEIFLV